MAPGTAGRKDTVMSSGCLAQSDRKKPNLFLALIVTTGVRIHLTCLQPLENWMNDVGWFMILLHPKGHGHMHWLQGVILRLDAF